MDNTDGTPVFRGWFTFSGRRNRLSYFLVGLVFFLALIGWWVLFITFISYGALESEQSKIGILLFLFVWVGFLILGTPVGIIITAQRFRDLEYSGWCALAYLLLGASVSYLPYLATQLQFAVNDMVRFIYILTLIALFLVWLTLLLVPGTRGKNKYGPDPLRYTLQGERPENEYHWKGWLNRHYPQSASAASARSNRDQSSKSRANKVNHPAT